MAFRLIAKIIFFTYSRCPLTPSYCIESLLRKLSSRRSPIGIIGYSVGLEHLTDGGLHIHVLIKLDKKIDLRDGRFFDIVDGDGETVYHPSVEECKNFNAARDYIRKEYKENLDAGHQSGDLLESWPEDVADDGRQKRKAAFDEEEFKEFVKKARSKTEFIDMLQERNPLALAQNFNNIIMFASYVFPAAVRETYQPGDWFNGFVNDDWLVRLTKECKSRIEAVSRGESVRSMYICGEPGTGKSTWARMLEPSATWFCRGILNFDKYRNGDKVFIFDDFHGSMLNGGELNVNYWEYKGFFGCQDEVSLGDADCKTRLIKGPWFFIFLHNKSWKDMGWENDYIVFNSLRAYCDCINLENRKFYTQNRKI